MKKDWFWAETGQWRPLLEQYLRELIDANIEQKNCLTLADKLTEKALLQRTCAKLNAGGLKQAKSLLSSGGKAPQTKEATQALR